MITFRIHFASGDKFDVEAETAAEARKKAGLRNAGIITKIKRVKDND